MPTSTAIETFNQGFAGERNQDTLKKYLANEDLQDRFTAVVTRAVQENPDLLQADRKSLFYACQRAAQDKLMPDGREGFLSIFNTNAGTKQAPNWIKKVQWQPMIYGLRKILGNYGYYLDAELVYENDTFEHHKGDNPHILHIPTRLGQDKGEMIGAYAIATEKATGQKHHETMDCADLEQVHMASKNPDGNVWKNWAGEMHRKAPAKRLFKRLPLPDDFVRLIDRDNEQFDMNKAPAVSSVAKQVQEHVRLAAPSQDAQLEPLVSEEPITADPVVIHHSEPEQEQVEAQLGDDWPDAGEAGQPREPDF